MVDYFAEHGMPDDPSKVTREHVEMFLADFAETHMPATVLTRFAALRVFWNFLAEEGEARESPMRNMRPPSIPETPVAVFSLEQLEALLKTADGKDFESLRNMAILRLFMDSGMRRGEMAGLRVEDHDDDQDVVYVVGKGSRPRACPFGARTGQAIDRYLRAREEATEHTLPWLWLGKKGRLSDSGVLQMVRRSGKLRGSMIHPHQLRHTFAHQWLSQGGNEGDLMRLAGWRRGDVAAVRRVGSRRARRGAPSPRSRGPAVTDEQGAAVADPAVGAGAHGPAPRSAAWPRAAVQPGPPNPGSPSQTPRTIGSKRSRNGCGKCRGAVQRSATAIRPT